MTVNEALDEDEGKWGLRSAIHPDLDLYAERLLEDPSGIWNGWDKNDNIIQTAPLDGWKPQNPRKDKTHE